MAGFTTLVYAMKRITSHQIERFKDPKGGKILMAAKKIIVEEDARDASLRVSKRIRDGLKAAAAVMGRPLYDVTNEAINTYLAGLKLGDPLQAIRRSSANAARRQSK